MLRLLTAGESHGKALVVVIDGLPAGLPVPEEAINRELQRRQMGYGRGGRMRIEKDRVDVLSGLRAGKTLGSPIALKIDNRDWENWKGVMDPFRQDPDRQRLLLHPRPGHADLAGGIKYDHHDLRNVLERASARETAARVAGGAVSRLLLGEFRIQIVGHVVELGGVKVTPPYPPLKEIARITEKSPLRCLDRRAERKMIEKIEKTKKEGDTLGGVVEILVDGLPVGLGSHTQWDRRLDGLLAQTLMSIQAIKGVEIGMGFAASALEGSKAHDEIFYDKGKKRFFRRQNNAGGLEGGITNGERLVLRAAMKPLSTLMHPLRSVSIQTRKAVTADVERADVTAVPAAAIVAENSVAFTLAQAFLEKFGGDSLREVRRNYEGYRKQVAEY